ncbi:MAG: YeeE/YedE family protein [Silvanigrellaceae bacterium]
MMALYGGLVIGLAAALLMLLNGRIMGISGIAGTFVNMLFNAKARTAQAGEFAWRSMFILGMLVGGVALAKFTSTFTDASMVTTNPVMLIVAGLLVGVGTRLGWGCTSGHGICGIARFSGRSVIATMIFIAAGMLAVAVVNAILKSAGVG